MRHIVMFSGGIGSWMAAKRVKEQHGPENMILLFTDTLIEDEDLYRFILEAAENIGAPLVWIQDGRTPWQVFFDNGMMGNTKADLCSRILKRELADSWVKERFAPHECVIYAGFDCLEITRFEGMARRIKPFICEAPLTEPPYLAKRQMLDILKKEGIEPPRLYSMGFSHNNCGGFCIKAGHAHFKLLARELPEVYALHEQREEKFRDHTGALLVTPIVTPFKDVAILRDRRGGVMAPFPLKKFREENVEGSGQIDEFDFGGCGCFSD